MFIYIALNCKLYIQTLLYYGTLYAEQSLPEHIHAAYMNADPALILLAAVLSSFSCKEQKAKLANFNPSKCWRSHLED